MNRTTQELRFETLTKDEASRLAYADRNDPTVDWRNWVGIVGRGAWSAGFTMVIADASELSAEEIARRNRDGRAQGFGGCECCGDTWDWKMAHVTRISESAGVFPTCEQCWRRQSVSERISAGRSMVGRWVAENGPVAAAELCKIEMAILQEGAV